MGMVERTYLYDSLRFFFRPRAMMTWLIYCLVTGEILKTFQDTLDNETSVTILDDRLRGMLGMGL